MRSDNVIPFKQNSTQIGWPAFVAVTFAICAALFAAILLSGGPRDGNAAVGVSDTLHASFGDCSDPDQSNCVVDGDTFWFAGNKIRIADINTPELGGAKCAYERELGEQAKDRLRALLNEGNFTLAPNPDGRDQDKYGRDLRIVMRGGESLGGMLVAEGLAEQWRGYKREWC